MYTQDKEKAKSSCSLLDKGKVWSEIELSTRTNAFHLKAPDIQTINTNVAFLSNFNRSKIQ